jgi:RecB family exonuclease
VKVAEESILFAGGPGDQAVRAMETIAGLGDRFAPHQISIAAPLDEVVPRLERAAERYAGVRARPAAGMPLARTGVFQLLLAIQTFLDGESFQAFAALLRHPDMERYLLRSAGVGSLETWLKEADEYGAKHIPGGGLEGPLLGMDREGWTGLSRARDAVRRLLAPLRERPVAPDAPVRVLERIYAGRRVSRDDPAARMEIRASEFIRKAIEELAGLPRDWCPETGPAVLRLILEIAARQTVPFEGGGDVFEILGWLELPMDPAPCAIVTGVNEGVLPETFGADALLPDRLRSELGVASSRRRLARDAYLLSLVVRSRRAVLICGRSGSGGDPLLPSRLLFAAEPDEVVRRVQRFADPDKDRPRVVVPRARLTSGLKSVFPELPRGRACSGIDSMRVTSFCTFLRSPYRFYLEHALGLAEYVDQPPEIDPMAFGVLIHEVLEAFGNGDVKDSSSEITIRDRLLDHLSTLAMARFGRAPAMAVSVQLAVAGARLSEFASWQARHRSAGWHIEVAEWRPAARMAPLLGLDPAFYLRGKIDRIDRHDDGSVAILDYKTGDDPKTPRQTHGRSGAWKDLQLPLYRHLAAERNLPEDPAKLVLAYVNIPGKPGKIDMYAADWGAEELADADAKARQVAARVRDGDWFELGPEPPEDGTFAALCGTSFMGAVASQEAELEGVDEDGGEA